MSRDPDVIGRQRLSGAAKRGGQDAKTFGGFARDGQKRDLRFGKKIIERVTIAAEANAMKVFCEVLVIFLSCLLVIMADR